MEPLMTPPKNKKKRDTSDHTQAAYQGIRKMLFHNDIVPGQKIAYRDLAERLGMSQTPVIQALKWLEFQGLVHHKRHRGYYTAPISLREVEEIYDFREQIELALLQKTMKTIDSQGVDALRSSLEAHLEAAREIYLSDRLLKDKAFHLTLASLSGNRVQHQTLRLLFDLLYLKYGGNILFSTSMKTADQDHKALYDCIASHDVKGAQHILSGHISRVKEHVIIGLRKMIEEKNIGGF